MCAFTHSGRGRRGGGGFNGGDDGGGGEGGGGDGDGGGGDGGGGEGGDEGGGGGGIEGFKITVLPPSNSSTPKLPPLLDSTNPGLPPLPVSPLPALLTPAELELLPLADSKEPSPLPSSPAISVSGGGIYFTFILSLR